MTISLVPEMLTFTYRKKHGKKNLENNLAWLGREVVCVNINIPESTAQGGGGRIRNRKPIGEIGCCDGWQSKNTDGSNCPTAID